MKTKRTPPSPEELGSPLLVWLVLLVRPSCTVLGHNNHVGIVSFVFGLQARQVSGRRHAPGCDHFTKTLQAMSGDNWATGQREKQFRGGRERGREPRRASSCAGSPGFFWVSTDFPLYLSNRLSEEYLLFPSLALFICPKRSDIAM